MYKVFVNRLSIVLTSDKNYLEDGHHDDFYAFIDAALENATLGEIVDSMKIVFGEWTEKTSI